MKKKNGWNVIGLIVGIAMILMGIVFASSSPDSYSTESADHVSFGGDFYTYEYDATRIAARNAAATANNIRELGETVSLYCGMAFVFAGLLVVVSYAKKIGEVKQANKLLELESAAAEPQTAPEIQE